MFEIIGISIHWYGLLIGVGVVLAMEISRRLAKKTDLKLLEMSMWWTVLWGVVGARIYHVVDYWSRYYTNNRWEVVAIWNGGLGIWGAIAGGAVGLYVFCIWQKQNFVKYMDLLVLGMPLAQAIGRVGNFINGELLGKNGEPLFAYEGGLNLVLFAILWRYAKNKRLGVASGIYLAGYGVIRVFLEFMRPSETIWRVGGFPMAVIFGVVAVFLGVWLIFSRKRRS